MMDLPAYQAAIARLESGGNYGAVGPVTRGDRPYGKYQVMGANVGPWTQQALGHPLTAQEFLMDPVAQDATFNHIFGDYVNRYGPQGAAQAWLGGPGAVGETDRMDVLGTSVGEYAQRFAAPLSATEAMMSRTPTGATNSFQPVFGDLVAANQVATTPFGDDIGSVGLNFLKQAEKRRQNEEDADRERRRALFAQPVVLPIAGLGGLYG